MAVRAEGQVWISRDDPAVMKYFAQGDEYWVQAAATYNVDTGSSVKKGMLVAPGVVAGTVRPAVFPRDVSKIMGIALGGAESTQLVRIVNYGFIKLSLADLQNVFSTQSDIRTSAAATSYYTSFGSMSSDGGGGNGWADVYASATRNGLGKCVYWFSGRTYKTGASAYAYADASAYPGKLTLATPSGYKPNGTEIPWSDSSLDVSYKDLPIIGTVANYTYDSSGNLTELVIHVNFSKFSRKIQFEYPSVGLAQYLSTNNPQSIDIRHGLFPNNTIVPHVEVTAWGYTDSNVETATDGESFSLHPGYDSYIGSGVDKRTEVEFASDTSFYYKLSGEVNYNQ